MKHAARPVLVIAVFAAAIGLSACASGPSATDVAGTSWGSAPDNQAQEPAITFERDGSYHGTDGCNVIGGEWTADGGTVDLGAMRSTMMYCEGVDTWLSQAATAEVANDEIVFSDTSGAEVGTLGRFDG